MNARPEPFVFHAQVGDGDLAAAALAAGSIIFREADPEYSDKALGHALELIGFADKYRKERDSRTVVFRPIRIVDVNPKKGISLFNTPSIKIL